MSEPDTTLKTIPDDQDDTGDMDARAVIGHEVKVQGDLSGREDLIINGTVEGSINFHESNVFIGEKGKVNADVTANTIVVEGEVKGGMRGNEQIIIKPTGRVFGDLRAPRVILNDGCQFKGSVDMEEKPHAPGELKVGNNTANTKQLPNRPLTGGGPKPPPAPRRKR